MLTPESHYVRKSITLYNLLVFNWTIFPKTNFVDRSLRHNLVNARAVANKLYREAIV